MRRVLFVAGWAIAGALVWAIIFGLALLWKSDDPADFAEQATFRTEKVVAVAGAAVADGPCGESKDDKGTRHTHGTSYEVDLTWTGADGDTHDGVMTTCNRPDEGEQLTVWVSSRDAVFNRSPLAMYSSVPIAGVLFALGAWGWTWLTKDERRRRARGTETLRRKLRRLRLRRLRLRELRRAKKTDRPRG
ncbi:hypothetical protein [Kribbella shirazensis]|uniref:Uncharacterized protein n=1 Tax=Kribbella shirazensis TaxID=1105143 RepID=A0A7X6A4N5_9ACTN|nr:hypothetical protein [Kribbella shirazensis]NIK60499.1 hypothetical protein [Kribbella shirazensis]